jgi:hypothetical protein
MRGWGKAFITFIQTSKSSNDGPGLDPAESTLVRSRKRLG